MKKIIVISLIAVILYFSFADNINKTITFNNEKYKIARTEGKAGFYKYHYTKSGRDTGSNDYIEVFKFDKSEMEPDRVKGIADFVKKTYKTKYVSGSSGGFGVFGPQNNHYAYTISSESPESYWFINYVMKSNPASASEAKSNASSYFNNLEVLVSEFKN